MLVKHIHLDLIDDLLGTLPGDTEIYERFIGSKAPDAMTVQEELENISTDEYIEKTMTMFPKKNGKPFMYPYQIRGFFKSACKANSKIKGTESSKLKAYKQNIDLRIFVYPNANEPGGREIIIHTDKDIATCQRPLRASTAQGERVALASSECIRAGAYLEFDVVMLLDDDWKMVQEWLDYGRFNGLGQWRNSGKGAFVWHEIQGSPTTIFK